MSKIKKIQLAAIMGISRAAVTKAEKSGLIVVEDGLIDIENPVNKYYVASRGISLSENEVEKSMKNKNQSDKKKQNIKESGISSEQLAEYIARKKKADAEHAELKNQKLRGELLDAEMVHDYIFLFLDKVSNNLQRNASSFLSDVADKIINENGLNSAIRNQWMNLVLNQFDTAKKEIIKRIEQIREKQNGK